MSAGTKIEWTDATWNPTTGCTKVSAGCDHCYAETLAERFRGTPGHYYEHGFDVQLRPDKLGEPLRWRKPRRIFVNSMSDLFDDNIPDSYIFKVFGVMAVARRHTFQLLTKRHARMRSLLSWRNFRDMVSDAAGDVLYEYTGSYVDWHDDVLRGLDHWPLPNVWGLVSAEDQQWADIRIPALLDTPFAVRGVSLEPLLGPIDLLGDAETPGPAIIRTGVHTPGGPWGPDEWDYNDQVGLDWVIVGGESGRGARPMQWDWVRSLRDQCRAAGVAFHFKQSGSVLAREGGGGGKGGDPAFWPEPFPREYPEEVPV
jgi:protein gp37